MNSIQIILIVRNYFVSRGMFMVRNFNPMIREKNNYLEAKVPCQNVLREKNYLVIYVLLSFSWMGWLRKD